MTLPYSRNFTKGRQADQFLTEELHQTYSALKNINYRKNEHRGLEPQPAPLLDGALWFDKVDNMLKYYDLPTRTWKCVFSKKFQITDQITNIFVPANPVEGQLWIYNGVLMYFSNAGWQPVKALIQDDTQWANAAFENFQIVSPLKTVEEINSGTSGKEDESFSGWYREYITDDKWNKDGVDMPELAFEPKYVPDNAVDDVFSYIIPNLHSDKVFVGNLHDDSYRELSKISFEYPRSYIHEERVSGVHINPGRLTGMKKQIFLVDKENPVIEKSAYNTEFYGFRRGEIFGYFLLPSSNQDEGDYTTSEDNIILNKRASENYDYIVSVTYEFTWVNSNGVLEKHNMNEGASSYYIMNLRDPVAVHVEGVKLEESAYDVNMLDSTITIGENVDKLDVDIWSPYKKQYGYVRRTEPVTGRAIIHLHEKISSPENVLVFLAGQLIHPIYGGITYDLGNRNIYVDNPNPEVDNMINMPWCIVDLAIDRCEKCGYVGVIKGQDCPHCTDEMKDPSSVEHADAEHSMDRFDGKADGEFVFDEEGNANFVLDDTIMVDEATNDVYLEGEKLDTSDPDIYDYILSHGKFETNGEGVIYYDTTKVQPTDGIILFVEGLLICHDDIIRDDKVGMIKVNGLVNNMEYVLLRDPEGRLYKSSDIMKAYSVGVLSDSLVYFNGKLILNDNCFDSYNTEDYNTYNNAGHNEIKCYVVDEYNDIKIWKIFDKYEHEWFEVDIDKKNDLDHLSSSYTNLLSSVQLNIDYSSDDNLCVYAFKFANTVSGYYQTGLATYKEDDPIDGRPIFSLGYAVYGYDLNNLNVFRNGVKLIKNVHYQELQSSNEIKLLINVETDPLTELFKDEAAYAAWKKRTGKENYISRMENCIKYVIEPIEHGETMGYEQVVLSNKNAIQPNIYELEDNDVDLYPGRITVFVNGLRIPYTDWSLLDNRHILLKYNNYLAVSEIAKSFAAEEFLTNDGNRFTVNHKYPDYIVVEIRKDYDRRETIIDFSADDGNEIYLDKKNIPVEILDTADEVLIYWNGQYTGLSRRSANDYYIDKYKGCITIRNGYFLEKLKSNRMKNVLDSNALNEAAWKKLHDTEADYGNVAQNKLTLIWRT